MTTPDTLPAEVEEALHKEWISNSAHMGEYGWDDLRTAARIGMVAGRKARLEEAARAVEDHGLNFGKQVALDALRALANAEGER